MKTIIIIFLSMICLFGKAQITGEVINEKGEKLEYATIYNLTRKTSSITNIEGFFSLKGEIGDSINIQHVHIFPLDSLLRTLNHAIRSMRRT